jgi:hypothetical protein
MDFRDTGHENVNWIELAHVKLFVIMVIIF